jgi:hypothetical protein
VANHILFTNKAARAFAWGDLEGYTEVVTEEGDRGRWQQCMRTVCKRDSDGKLFALGWQRGLTEYQENDYDGTAFEVEAVEQVRTITETVYRKKQ